MPSNWNEFLMLIGYYYHDNSNYYNGCRYLAFDLIDIEAAFINPKIVIKSLSGKNHLISSHRNAQEAFEAFKKEVERLKKEQFPTV